MVDVCLQIDRGRLQVGVTELSLEVAKGDTKIEGMDRVKVPQGMWSNYLERLAVLIPSIDPLDLSLHSTLVDYLTYPRRGHGFVDTLAWEDII